MSRKTRRLTCRCSSLALGRRVRTRSGNARWSSEANRRRAAAIGDPFTSFRADEDQREAPERRGVRRLVLQHLARGFSVRPSLRSRRFHPCSPSSRCPGFTAYRAPNLVRFREARGLSAAWRELTCHTCGNNVSAALSAAWRELTSHTCGNNASPPLTTVHQLVESGWHLGR